MTVRFILGRAGSGKTLCCLQSIAQLCRREPTGAPLIFLVPEQATFQMEKELALLCGGGTFRAQVLSFRRLAYRLLRQRGSHLPEMSELGRQMALRRILQEKAEQFSTFSRAARQPRFCEQLAVQVREFKNYFITPEILQDISEAASCPEALRGKIADMALVYQAYRSFTDGRFLDPEDTLTMLAAELENGALPAGTRVWVDGFAGFTPQELTVLAALFRFAHSVDVALCLDPHRVTDQPQEDDLFHPTLDTYLRLRRVAGETGVAALPRIALPESRRAMRFNDPALSHLEEQFGEIPGSPYQERAEAVRLVTAAGSRAEVEAAARDILHAVREKGWRYRDIGVILRDFARYHDLVAAIFTEYNIPYFIDDRRSAAHHPLVEFLRSALDAALTNLGREPVMQMLKTGLFPVDRLAVDRLENYARAHGIRGSRWLDGNRWTYRLRLAVDDSREDRQSGPDELAAIHTARTEFCRIYSPFMEGLSGAANKDAVTYGRLLWQLLERAEAAKTLEQWVSRETAAGRLEAAAEHRQVWNGIIELLNQTAGILGDRRMTLQEFSQVFMAGLESLKLGLVPAGLDQVTVGSVERSRQPRLRAGYVLGLSEGDFPARLKDDGLFADEERAAIGETGVELAVTHRQKLFHEQYLAYIAVTRGSEYLWASFPLADEEGKAKRPSSLFNRLHTLFPRNEVAFYGNSPDAREDFHALAGPEKSASVILLQAGRLAACGGFTPFWAAVYNEALQVPEIRARLQGIWPALTEHNHLPPLQTQTVAAVFGRPLKCSVSRLEQFARCPFAHFARYGLRLEERRELRVEAPDMGTFYHTALCRFVQGLLSEGIAWGSLSEEEAVKRMHSVVDELVPLLHGEILLSSARMRFLAGRLKETLSLAVAALTEHAKLGRFFPVAAELKFGAGDVPPWRLTDAGTELSLYGQIDRIDLFEDEEKAYLRVIDYKSSPLELKLSDVRHGLSLQLLAYLAVVTEHAGLFTDKPAVGAGALYFGIHQPYERVDNPPPAGRDGLDIPKLDGIMLADTHVLELMGGPDLVHAALKKDGAFTKHSRVADAEQLAALLSCLREQLTGLAGEIQQGRVNVYPFKKDKGQRACAFCPYLPVCRFDPAVEGNRYRFLRSYPHGRVLEEAVLLQKGGEADGDSLDG